MSFVLRIFFSGLIAFSPSPDQKELNVLLLDAGHNFTLTNGTHLAEHHPLLLARAARCAGPCQAGAEVASIASDLFPGVAADRAVESLQLALLEGGAWRLGRSELSIEPTGAGAHASPTPLMLRHTLTPLPDGSLPVVPATPEERADFHWVPELERVAPSSGGINPAVLAQVPPNLIAARLKLTSGTVSTYRLVRIAENVEPIPFLPAQGGGSATPYRQALASWVIAELQIEGSEVEIAEANFCGEVRRTMKLSPQQGGEPLVEIAVLNLPPVDPSLRSAVAEGRVVPAPGQHFEAYYKIAREVPAAANQLIPMAAERATSSAQPQTNWRALHPLQQLQSDLLEKILLGIDRGPYDMTLCPMIQVRPGG
jgi:hypothetical protein